jgi:hypothetical protein
VLGYVFDASYGAVADARADLFVETDRWGRGCSALGDRSGRFVAYLPASRVSVHIDKLGVVQPCAVAVEIRGAVNVAVEVTRRSTLQNFELPRPEVANGITLGGTIVETDGGVRRPIPGAEVFTQRYDDIPVATTVSGPGGGYFVCNLPSHVGVYVSMPGYATAFVAVDPLQSPTLDIELRRAHPASAPTVTSIAGNAYGVANDGAFSIHGVRVVRPPELGASSTVVNGAFVSVRGLISDDVLNATEIDVVGEGRSYQLDGQVEALHTGLRSVRVLGVEMYVNEWTDGSLARWAIGDWVAVRAHRNRFVQGIGVYSPYSRVRTSRVDGAWFKDVLPPTAFSLDSVVDFPVQVTPSTSFRLAYGPGDGECYGWDLLSGDEFWQHASGPPPVREVSVTASGRFEGALLVADEVVVCYP